MEKRIKMDSEWDLIQLGCNGQFDLIPKNSDGLDSLIPLHSLPFGLPPVLPDLKTQLEEFICCPEKLPIHSLEQAQKYWPRKPNPEKLFSMELSPQFTDLMVERDSMTGELKGFAEVEIFSRGTAKNSVSMCRLPGPPSEAVRGSYDNLPFLPGGMDQPVVDKLLKDIANTNFETDLLTVPPGFEKGMIFEKEIKLDESSNKENEDKNVLNLADVLKMEAEFSFLNETKEIENKVNVEKPQIDVQLLMEDSETAELESAIMKEVPVLNISETKPVAPTTTEWVEIVNVTEIPDFEKQVPNMAHQWKFKPDPFQQHAILHLERQECVFVAAHTSAGKTVVAEYAIALSQRNKTRTIYTSPIKALSNQKFRDFKNTFEDVGILTGDIQINDKAACLIMTTEILRSMLYRGADTIRDVEWVIFDEVHYINDKERGVVWEEVLIMLPEHVNIVMLSATVPNFLEFANWVGKTKKKKIYVVCTQKRPVPLEHYLYTGSGGKTKDEMFLIVNAESKFVLKGYKDAKDAMSVHQKKMTGGPKKGHPISQPRPNLKIPRKLKQEETMWNGLIAHLNKKELLPVIAFTLSRKRCDENAELLSKVDLMKNEEKDEIRENFKKWICQLKACDRQLPQVKNLKRYLLNGVGIHHSGILPILKEIVEMLFAKGLVKLLFATETFAIGVNMPARTVVFDSILKFDGREKRHLEPSEYIQMAGRAGRRKLDSRGVVIVLCKKNIPDELALRQMMQGKPTKLESQFRLTYSMILKLLMRRQFRVEDMIKRSFIQKMDEVSQKKFEEQLRQLRDMREKTQDITCRTCSVDLKEFCYQSLCAVQGKEKLQTDELMVRGRVVVIYHPSQGNTLGVIVKSNPLAREKSYKILYLTQKPSDGETSSVSASDTAMENSDDTVENDWRKMKVLISDKIFTPEQATSHSVTDIKTSSPITITKEILKLDFDKILTDWNKRLQARFKDDPPNEACNAATRELLRLSEENQSGFQIDDILSAFKIKDINLLGVLDAFQKHVKSLSAFKCINCPDFDTHVKQEFSNVKVNQDIEELEFKLSDSALQSIPDFKARIEVLKQLGYVNETGDMVQLRGKVACIISNHELMVTELVLNESLMDLRPEEIAALLSCLVFQQKMGDEKIELEHPNLETGRKKILEITDKITKLEKEFGVEEDPSGEYESQFNFGLADVVYEWANAVPFSKLTEMTDVQEGMIVRTIQRLDEVVKDLKSVGCIIGNPSLEHKMMEVSTRIRRDIVFAASLYTQDFSA